MTLVAEVDFAILVLRICSYALQFLPSPGYTLDKIRGVLLADIRNTCYETADNLEAISTAADARGSLIRVQHMAFFGLQGQIEGKTNGFWEPLSRAIPVAHNFGIHCDAVSSRKGTDKSEREMERRTFCNLYIWDNLLSRQLDRVRFLPGFLRLEAGRSCISSEAETAMEETKSNRALMCPTPSVSDFSKLTWPISGAASVPCRAPSTI